MDAETLHTKLTVVGGGPAGVTAALTAARLGMDTLLVTNRPVLGGNSSSEIRVWTRGATGGGNLFAEEMGVWGSLKMENLYRNPEGNPILWDDVLLDAVLRQDQLKLLLNTDADALEMHGNRVSRLSARQQNTELTYSIISDWYIDATGDGLLGYWAGLPYYMGNQRVQGGQQPHAPYELLGSSILFYTEKLNHAVSFSAPSYALPINEVEKLLGNGGRIVSPGMSGSDCWWFELGGRQNTITDDDKISHELRRLVMGIWNYIKNSGKYDAYNYTLSWVGNLPGKRESRRIETEYMLQEEDILAGRKFEDGAFYGGWFLDVHPSGGALDADSENCIQTPVSAYQIPLRGLYNHSVSNLLFVGRCIGTQRAAFFSTRVMDTCALSGQAAATLAVQCENSDTYPSSLTTFEVQQVQQQLLKDDMLIPGVSMESQTNLAASAHITCQYHDGTHGPIIGTLSLGCGSYVTFPGTGVDATLEISCKTAATVSGTLYAADLPNRFTPGKPIGRYQWELHAGSQTIAFPSKDGQFCTMVFDPSPDAEIAICKPERTGFICGITGSLDISEPALNFKKPVVIFTGEQLVSGYTHPWCGVNQWCAARNNKSPAVTLTWDKPQHIHEIRLFFDTELSMELPSSHPAHWLPTHKLPLRTGMPPQLVRDFVIERETSQGWIQIAERKDNIQRLVTLQFDDIEVSTIRIVCKTTWGNMPPRIYSLLIL